MGHLRGEYLVSAKGGKLYGFINGMQHAGICCRKQHCKGDTFFFVCEKRNCGAIKKLAEGYGVTLAFTLRPTLSAFLFRYRFRMGIPIGILLSGAFLFYCSNIVMKIEIIGNELATETEILAILEEQGVRSGSWIPSISFSTCEHAIRAGVEEFAWVGMRHTGNRLVIEVMEADPTPEMLEERIPSNLIASVDGQIVSVSVACGQLMKLVGEPVKKGELLVSGVTTDLTGHTTIRHALGEIIGQYEQTQQFACAYIQEANLPTGEKESLSYFDFFTWHIPLGRKTDAPQNCIRTGSHSWFSFLGKELPLGIYRETRQICQVKTVTYTKEEAEQNLTEQEQRYQENFLKEVELLDKKIAVLETENGLVWDVTYTLQGNIGVQQELWIRSGETDTISPENP